MHILVGYSEVSKAYKLYNLITKKIIISRDAKFNEDEAWNWDEKQKSVDVDMEESNGAQSNELGGNEEDRTPPTSLSSSPASSSSLPSLDTPPRKTKGIGEIYEASKMILDEDVVYFALSRSSTRKESEEKFCVIYGDPSRIQIRNFQFVVKRDEGLSHSESILWNSINGLWNNHIDFNMIEYLVVQSSETDDLWKTKTNANGAGSIIGAMKNWLKLASAQQFKKYPDLNLTLASNYAFHHPTDLEILSDGSKGGTLMMFCELVIDSYPLNAHSDSSLQHVKGTVAKSSSDDDLSPSSSPVGNVSHPA
ncbi:hypothetical protein HHK36_017772 [Tetracentron sinense]|uniref:Retroviral polymerase SH3-like domain-containing protein n=1 Tax=Tetracentron sinense TaxID=13715 RepID=A0A834YUT0_TETSI|nr:hypothetical protein HHK36_017772 [Tetracentron sinense]